MKTLIIALFALSSFAAMAKNKVINIDDVRVSKPKLIELRIGESSTPQISLWTNDDHYPAQVVVSCVNERVAFSSKKGKTYEIDLVSDKNRNRSAQIQLRPGESVDLENVFYHCQQ
jgi:hypothetical protein